ncbi:hydroxymethylpyrimidine/phosphomethylpyrimidine kinase [Pseudoclavibacter caeni]|jgi:pyridoxine kinase|uniref:pyridoxal kinase n=1 Tax=Pseudoclavibacter caeni TaxID=908846 RepID=A0A7C8BPA9_9MICO|nr:hydroxymethylpyrimidine/phosphomethylpyrimidine kinase [Pseudoclavibacter caeni]KAB1633035.1 hydroxymethylpyrimidine/phosphomethylpyrimidine kinase [Pseudoclavibacter caeni]NYJ96980.1 pyridoxine kinase [Pseudoclavibacter caeni]
MTSTPAFAMTIAGSEATGGAGAQADLKTFQQLGVFGSIALTCIVSFDPKHDWGHRFVPVDPQVISDQIEAITAAYGPDQLQTVKIGMLGTLPTIERVHQALTEREYRDVVLDPVLICKGQEPGAALDTDQALMERLLPLATFVTPNHYEAQRLSGLERIDTEADLIEAAKRINDRSGAAVLAKGGVRIPGPEAIDVFYDGTTLEVLRVPKVGEHVVAGAGCSLAAAVTAGLALGDTPLEAAHRAKTFVTAGIRGRVHSRAPFDVLWQGAATA